MTIGYSSSKDNLTFLSGRQKLQPAFRCLKIPAVIHGVIGARQWLADPDCRYFPGQTMVNKELCSDKCEYRIELDSLLNWTATVHRSFTLRNYHALTDHPGLLKSNDCCTIETTRDRKKRENKYWNEFAADGVSIPALQLRTFASFRRKEQHQHQRTDRSTNVFTL